VRIRFSAGTNDRKRFLTGLGSAYSHRSLIYAYRIIFRLREVDLMKRCGAQLPVPIRDGLDSHSTDDRAVFLVPLMQLTTGGIR